MRGPEEELDTVPCRKNPAHLRRGHIGRAPGTFDNSAKALWTGRAGVPEIHQADLGRAQEAIQGVGHRGWHRGVGLRGPALHLLVAMPVPEPASDPSHGNGETRVRRGTPPLRSVRHKHARKETGPFPGCENRARAAAAPQIRLDWALDSLHPFEPRLPPGADSIRVPFQCVGSLLLAEEDDAVVFVPLALFSCPQQWEVLVNRWSWTITL